MRCIIFRRSLRYGSKRTSGVIDFPVFWEIGSGQALCNINQQEGNKDEGRTTYSELAVGCNFNYWRIVALGLEKERFSRANCMTVCGQCCSPGLIPE